MPVPVEVRPISNKKEFKAFFEFPWTLYKDDPYWVPPLLSMRRDLLDKEKNPAWEYMEGEYYAAWRGDQIVGTITAHINHRHNEFANEHVGWFGMFETYDDQEVANLLIDTAAKWVQERGYDAIRGPQSFTTHEECGLLIEGFNRPVLLMPYNFPYYQKLVETAGLVKVMDTQCIYLDRELGAESGLPERLDKLVSRASKRSGITIRPFNQKKRDEEFKLFKELYNQAWDANWGFVPMTERELDALVESLGMFFEPKMAFFADIDGDPAGFVLSLPDFNEVLQYANPRPGVPEFISLIRAGWGWKVKRIITGVRMPLMGVKKKYRERGVELAMFDATVKALYPTQYTYLDAGWILEINPLLKIMDSLGAKRYKRHRFYERRFDS